MHHRRFYQQMALLYAIQHQPFQFQGSLLVHGKQSIMDVQLCSRSQSRWQMYHFGYQQERLSCFLSLVQ